MLGVANLDFVASFVLFGNGDVDENPVFKISFGFNRNRSRKSHADVCLTNVGRATAESFFVVLNVARAGLIGVVVVGVGYFKLIDEGGFVLFTFGVYLDDILHTIFVFESLFPGFLVT